MGSITCEVCDKTLECHCIGGIHAVAFGVQRYPNHYDWITAVWEDKPLQIFCEACWDKLPDTYKDTARAEREKSLLGPVDQSEQVVIRQFWNVAKQRWE